MRNLLRLAIAVISSGVLFGAENDSLLPIQPLTINLRKETATNALPPWFAGKISVLPESDGVEVPLPALATQDVIGFHAVTVVFDDNGDGGPVVEWISHDKNRSLLSAGLGETGVAPGLNARTILIPQGLTLDGGTLRVSFAGRFQRLLTVSVQPCRELGVAAMTTGNGLVPGLVIGRDRILALSEVYDTPPPLAQGDRSEGRTVHAELFNAASRLDSTGQMEIIVPMGSLPAGSWISSEVAGLDPESWIEVSINGESLGAIGMEPFPLQDSATLFSPSGRLLRAGWRRANLYVPPRLWKDGENSVSITLRRSTGDEGRPVLVRNASLELLYPLASEPKPVGAESYPLSESPASAKQTNGGGTNTNGVGQASPSFLYRATIPPESAKVTEPSLTSP
jgi:hypothetical protein